MSRIGGARLPDGTADRGVSLVIEGSQVLDLCVDLGFECCHPLLLLPVIDLKTLQGVPPHDELVDPGCPGGDDVADHLPGHHRLFDIRGVDEAHPRANERVHVCVDGMSLDVGLDPGQLRIAVGNLSLETVEVGRNCGQLCGEVADPGDADGELGLDLGPPADCCVDQPGGDLCLPLRCFRLLL